MHPYIPRRSGTLRYAPPGYTGHSLATAHRHNVGQRHGHHHFPHSTTSSMMGSMIAHGPAMYSPLYSSSFQHYSNQYNQNYGYRRYPLSQHGFKDYVKQKYAAAKQSYANWKTNRAAKKAAKIAAKNPQPMQPPVHHEEQQPQHVEQSQHQEQPQQQQPAEVHHEPPVMQQSAPRLYRPSSMPARPQQFVRHYQSPYSVYRY